MKYWLTIIFLTATVCMATRYTSVRREAPAVTATVNIYTNWYDPNTNFLWLWVNFQATNTAQDTLDGSTNHWNIRKYPSGVSGPTYTNIGIVNSRTNWGVTFDGVDDCFYFATNSPSFKSTNWTCSVWVKADNRYAIGSRGYIYDNQTQRYLFRQSGTDTNFTENISNTNAYYAVGQLVLADGAWHNVTRVMTETNKEAFYFDGTLLTNFVGANICTNIAITAGAINTLGSVYNGTASTFWNGAMDDFKIYMTAESAAQVADRVAHENPTNNWVVGWN